MMIRGSLPSAARILVLAVAMGGMSAAALARDSPATPEVRVQASKVVKKAVKSPTGISIETAVVALRVGYGDLALKTNAGQAQLKDRVAGAAKNACSRVGAAFGPGMHITSTSECVDTAIKDAQLQVEAVIAAANAQSAGTP
jgi:UrcA family protein